MEFGFWDMVLVYVGIVIVAMAFWVVFVVIPNERKRRQKEGDKS